MTSCLFITVSRRSRAVNGSASLASRTRNGTQRSYLNKLSLLSADVTPTYSDARKHTGKAYGFLFISEAFCTSAAFVFNLKEYYCLNNIVNSVFV